MKWIKSPEVPKEKGAYWCILNDGLGSKNGAYFNGEKWETYKDRFILEWLDESTPSQVGNELKYSYADMQACWNEAEQYGIRGNDEKGSMTLDTFLNKRTQVGNKARSIEEVKKDADKVAAGLGYKIDSLSLEVINVKDAYCMGYFNREKEIAQVGNTSGYEWKQPTDPNELPYLAPIGNTTQGEKKWTDKDMSNAYNAGISNCHDVRQYGHSDVCSEDWLSTYKPTPTTQSEGEEKKYTQSEFDTLQGLTQQWINAAQSSKSELQALKLSNEQGDKLVIELQGNLDDQKVKMGEITNMWLGANEENRSLRLSNSKLVEASKAVLKWYHEDPHWFDAPKIFDELENNII